MGRIEGGAAGELRGVRWRRSRAGAEPRRAGAEPPQAAKRPGCAGWAGREKCSGREGAEGRWRGFWRAGGRGRRSRAGAEPRRAGGEAPAGREAARLRRTGGERKCSGREGAEGRWRGFWRCGAKPRRAGAEPPQAAKRPGCAGWAGREKPRRGSAGWGQTSIWELRRARRSVSQRSWPLGAAPQPSARKKVPSVKVM